MKTSVFQQDIRGDAVCRKGIIMGKKDVFHRFQMAHTLLIASSVE